MIKSKSCILCNTKTKWPYFEELVTTTFDNSISLKTEGNIICAIESFNYIAGHLKCNADSGNLDISIHRIIIRMFICNKRLAERRKLNKL
jgi:hypothetical protein